MGGNFRLPMTRRNLLRRMALLSAAAWAAPLVGSTGREAWARTAGSVLDPRDTTLEASIMTVGDGPYFRLGFGPGWPLVVRDDLAAPQSGRQDRRVSLAAVTHYTDFQLVDAQSPARVEFLDTTADPPSPIPFGAAFRPQEALVSHVVEALVRHTRTIGRGPVTGRQVDCVVCTGDNLDNAAANEMRWFRTLMDGGTFAPNSGAADAFEGVQSFDDPTFYRAEYWHPEEIGDARGDFYKDNLGFPSYPGLLDAAIGDIQAVGLPARWYSCYGNHDFLAQGNAQPNAAFEGIATSGTKVLGPPAAGPRAFEGQSLSALLAAGGPARPVTADDERSFLSPAEYIQAHLDSPASPGPVGHGFTQDNLDPLTLYYTFEVAPGITGITLDTTAPAASEGAFGVTQAAWLEERLQEVHSRYFEEGGTEATTGNDDELVIIFSHHRPSSINQTPVQRKRDMQPEQGLSGDQLLELLHRYPNVILWVNGHSHFNRIEVHPDPAERTGGIWDITTAAQIDPPQQARILEVVDNRDGTLSIFTTVIDHGAPPGTDGTKLDLLGLASIGRELAFNDFQSDVASAIGEPSDLNTELLVRAPFDVASAGGGSGGSGGGGGGGAPDDSSDDGGGGALAATGGGTAAVAALATAAAVAVRRGEADGE